MVFLPTAINTNQGIHASISFPISLKTEMSSAEIGELYELAVGEFAKKFGVHPNSNRGIGVCGWANNEFARSIVADSDEESALKQGVDFEKFWRGEVIYAG